MHLLAPLLASLNPAIYIVSHKELSIEGAWGALAEAGALGARAHPRMPSPFRAPAAASAAQDVFNARMLRLEQKVEAGGAVAPAELEAARQHADEAIKLFAHFIRCAPPRARAVARVRALCPTAADPPRCYRDGRLGEGAPPTDGSNAPVAPLSGATELDSGSAEAYMTAHLSIARLLSRRPCSTVQEKVQVLSCRWGGGGRALRGRAAIRHAVACPAQCTEI